MPGRTIRAAVVAAIIAVVSIMQLAIGGDPMVLALADLGILISATPVIFSGFGLLTLTPLLFLVRYYGLAVALKSLRLQTIQSDLLEPSVTYGLAIGILASVTMACVIASCLTPARGLFRDPTDDRTLLRAAWVMFALGLVGEALNLGGVQREGASVSTGALHQVGALLAPLYYGAIVVGATRAYRLTKGRHLLDPHVLIFLLLGIAMAVLAGSREVMLDCAVCLLVVALINNFLRASYIVIGLLLLSIFSGFISPVILHSRADRSGQSASTFASSAAATASQALSSPTYLGEIKDEQKLKAQAVRKAGVGQGGGDYLGNGSNVENRLAWIGLLDNVYVASRADDKLHFSMMGDIWNRIKPRALFHDKEFFRGTYSDDLSIRFGLEDANLDAGSALNFGLPMEGLVSFGVFGLMLYPFLAVVLFFAATSIFSSIRQNSLIAVAIFCSFQHPLFENQVDGMIIMVIRAIPTLAVLLALCFWAARRWSTAGLRGQKRAEASKPFRYGQAAKTDAREA